METRSYSNAKIIGAAILSLLGALTLLILFIIFVSIKKPSYGDLNKFIFITLCISFGLFVIYAICAVIKNARIQTYALKTWLCCLITSVTIIVLSVISLLKFRERKLPTACLWISIVVAALIFFINTEYCLDDMMKEFSSVGSGPGYIIAEQGNDMETTRSKGDNESKEEIKDFSKPVFNMQSDDTLISGSQTSGVEIFEGNLRKELNAPPNSIVDVFKKESNEGRIVYKKTHFMLAIEAGYHTKRKWGQIINGIKVWLKLLNDEDNLVSLFTFDSTFYIKATYKTPSKMLEIISKGVEARGSRYVEINPVFVTFSNFFKSNERISTNSTDYLQYGFILIGEDVNYTEMVLQKLLDNKRKNDINFFLNITSQVNSQTTLTQIATELKGVHYSIREGRDLGHALVESLLRDPNSK